MFKRRSKQVIENGNLLLFIFIFSIMFSFKIDGFNMRYFVIIFWLFYTIPRIRKIKLNTTLLIFPISLYIIIMYSLLLVGLLDTQNSFEVLRSSRAILTYFIILFFFSTHNYSLTQVMNVVLAVLITHALSILIGIVFPPFKNIILPISQYSIEFMRIRSSGLLSGYDDAGFLCNIGLLLVLIKNTFLKTKLVDRNALIFISSVIFTSRVNIVVMGLVLSIVFVVNLLKMNIKGLLNISKYLIVIGLFSLVVLSLSTNFGYELRYTLLNYFPDLSRVMSLMEGSYTDYGIHSGVISRHLSLSELSLNQIIFGAGLRKTNSDVGYIKTIFSIGIIGIIIQVMTYLRAIISVNNERKSGRNNDVLSIVSIVYVIAIILMFLMELKISIISSSTTFEMLSVLYISIIRNKDVSWQA